MENNKTIRHAVRAVVIDKNEKVAILSANDGEHYKIPGGGIDKCESLTDALRREVLEETGCEIETICGIGEQEFESSDSARIHHSVCYLAKVKGNKGKPNFDDYEKERKFKLLWVDIDNAIKLLEECKPEYAFNTEIVKRDLKFLYSARNLIKQ